MHNKTILAQKQHVECKKWAHEATDNMISLTRNVRNGKTTGMKIGTKGLLGPGVGARPSE